jgi:hypothetical protein
VTCFSARAATASHKAKGVSRAVVAARAPSATSGPESAALRWRSWRPFHVDQRPGPWQRFLLLKLCFAETGRVPDEFNKPVFQHSSTLPVATAAAF